MKNKYNNIQQLIAFWQQYEEGTDNPDFSAFGIWLTEPGHEEAVSSGDHPAVDKEPHTHDPAMSEIDIRQRLLELFSRVNRIQEYYTKRLFEGLPLRNFLEFNFLFSLNKHASYRKKEIIDINLVEYSTGIDIIKRLIKLRLVDEFPDQLDKRSKRLKITPKGKRVLIDALMVISKIGNLLFDPFESEERDCCLHALTRLEHYHTRILNKWNSVSGFEILKIIEEGEKEMLNDNY